MYYRLKNDKFCGFYENNNEEGTFIEISQTDWNDVLNKQSLGEVIFYNKKTKKLYPPPPAATSIRRKNKKQVRFLAQVRMVF